MFRPKYKERQTAFPPSLCDAKLYGFEYAFMSLHKTLHINDGSVTHIRSMVPHFKRMQDNVAD